MLHVSHVFWFGRYEKCCDEKFPDINRTPKASCLREVDCRFENFSIKIDYNDIGLLNGK